MAEIRYSHPNGLFCRLSLVVPHTPDLGIFPAQAEKVNGRSFVMTIANGGFG
jgi:hypothetical protein